MRITFDPGAPADIDDIFALIFGDNELCFQVAV
jgi:hypothetical protein